MKEAKRALQLQYFPVFHEFCWNCSEVMKDFQVKVVKHTLRNNLYLNKFLFRSVVFDLDFFFRPSVYQKGPNCEFSQFLENLSELVENLVKTFRQKLLRVNFNITFVRAVFYFHARFSS